MKKARKKQAQLEFDTLVYRRKINFHSMLCAVELHRLLFCKKRKKNIEKAERFLKLLFRKTMVRGNF
jgi:hypothetical protein